MKKCAIIIGAGPAGITAACELLRRSDVHPIVLEESDAIGGISRTVAYRGNRIDIGGHRFFSKNQDVMRWWQDVLPLQGVKSCDDELLGRDCDVLPGGPDPARADRVMLHRKRISRILYLRCFFDYPISLKPQTFLNMGLARTLLVGAGYLKGVAFKREEKSLEDFMVNRFGRPLYRMFFEDYTRKVWGLHPSQLSAAWGAQRIKGVSLSRLVLSVFAKAARGGRSDSRKTETSLIEQFHYPKFGPGQLWETAAERVVAQGGEIRRNCKVVRVLLENGSAVGVEVETAGGREVIRGDYVLSSMPVKDLVASFDPELVPAEVADTARELPYRDFITVGVLARAIKIKNNTRLKTVNDIAPDCWIYVQERDVRVGRLQIFNNWSPYLVEDWRNKVWLGLEYFCNEGDEQWLMPEDEFIRKAVDELVAIGIVDQADVVDTVCIKVKKAYPAYFGAYENFGAVRRYLDGIGRLYCIGRNGQHRYNNMDHSMMTAMVAVDNIVEGVDGKERLWSVNSEEEYHESK